MNRLQQAIRRSYERDYPSYTDEEYAACISDAREHFDDQIELLADSIHAIGSPEWNEQAARVFRQIVDKTKECAYELSRKRDAQERMDKPHDY